jgi:hypothetical protein
VDHKILDEEKQSLDTLDPEELSRMVLSTRMTMTTDVVVVVALLMMLETGQRTVVMDPTEEVDSIRMMILVVVVEEHIGLPLLNHDIQTYLETGV